MPNTYQVKSRQVIKGQKKTLLNFFTSSLTLQANKLERLPPAKPFQSSLIFESKDRASGATIKLLAGKIS
jgi:hypothetical protein